MLATAGGLVFYGQPNGGFAAVESATAKRCGNSRTNVRMKASAMVRLGWQQYIAVAAGPNILCSAFNTRSYYKRNSPASKNVVKE